MLIWYSINEVWDGGAIFDCPAYLDRVILQRARMAAEYISQRYPVTLFDKARIEAATQYELANEIKQAELEDVPLKIIKVFPKFVGYDKLKDNTKAQIEAAIAKG